MSYILLSKIDVLKNHAAATLVLPRNNIVPPMKSAGRIAGAV
jgi:hypothetical protein